jgi:hypothetical protein
VESLKKWGKEGKEIKYDAVSILVKNEQGKGRKTKTDALVRALVGVLSGGVTLVGGAIVGCTTEADKVSYEAIEQVVNATNTEEPTPVPAA